MTKEFGPFSGSIAAAESLGTPCKVAIVCPDEAAVRAGLMAEASGLAKSCAFGTEVAGNIETCLAGSQEEALAKAIDFCVANDNAILMKGHINTNLFLKAIINSPFRSGYLTHCSVLGLAGRETPLVVSDGTVTPCPDLAQKAEITRNAIRCAHIFAGPRPVSVAILSANELVLPGVSSGSDAAILAKMAERGQISGAVVEGPMALDSALSKAACERKGLHFAFEPPADVLIAPDLESGAMLVKSAVYLAGASVAGMLFGARRPVVLTSRADTEVAKYISLCLCKLAMAES